ncbi:helix-turn-helix domain-containing protein [Nocardia farcinica]|uniref:Putative excision nuclease n=1 Tax=Nocardia farcinica (strain IFM 10152) TaxID=247156 RepID=Q5Z3Y7_NOCFA|nr:helix-turn-helix domain-containing protein [Nocardia farcinica]BAD54854.1 putative excision nuclease [Nocardia farcinica IFM 10152]
MTELKAEPRLHPVPAVMSRLGVGRSKVFELIESGELRSVKIGRRRLVSEASLIEFIEKADEAGRA